MTYRGRVQNGVIVIEGDVTLPEGTIVIVQTAEAGQPGAGDDPLYRIDELAMPTGVPDLAQNIDHYLYGHPKVSDAGQ